MRKAISQQVSVGEQPGQSDLEELKKDGVTTVVNLRLALENSPLNPAEERAIAEKLGLQYHHLPISLDKLDIDQVKELRERKLGFPVQDEKLKAFFGSLKE
jgi:protein tyrosine phosphatase (PTP) superfamily phosphohydrolase (DUF442 family)